MVEVIVYAHFGRRGVRGYLAKSDSLRVGATVLCINIASAVIAGKLARSAASPADAITKFHGLGKPRQSNRIRSHGLEKEFRIISGYDCKNLAISSIGINPGVWGVATPRFWQGVVDGS